MHLQSNSTNTENKNMTHFVFLNLRHFNTFEQTTYVPTHIVEPEYLHGKGENNKITDATK